MQNDVNKSRKCEILAPAGEYKTMLAAFNAGADAVYVGGSMFGARAFAGNFSDSELLEAIDYAHFFDKNLYLTVNTLLKDIEIEERLFEYLSPFYEAGLDAVIVQDLGVMQFITKNFPKLPIHCSTQMTITGSEYSKSFLNSNVTRIVTPRELNLAEIKDIYDATGLEIESFVHGALCYCYSGQCLLSSVIGGRSGNRGRCAQPCRLQYSSDELNIKNKYLLSPKDLCSLTILPDVLEAGVYSLKIEGRMKKPEYVASVVSMYRKYVDMYYSLGREKYKVSDADINLLKEIYNRGGFTEGFYKKQNDSSIMTIERPNHTGVKVGKIVGISKNSMTVKAIGNIDKGDILEIGNGTMEFFAPYDVKMGATFEYKHKDIRNFKEIDIYRTRSEKIINSYLNKYLYDSKGEYIKMNKEVSISIYFVAGEKIKAVIDDGDIVCEKYGQVPDLASKKPISKEDIIKQFSKTGGTEFVVKNINVICDDGLFAPISSLNELRRSLLEEYRREKLLKFRREKEVPVENNISKVQKKENGDSKVLSVLISLYSQFRTVISYEVVKRIYIELANFSYDQIKEMIKECKHSNIPVFIALPYITRNRAKQDLLQNIDFFNNVDIDGFLFRNLETYYLFKNKGITCNKAIFDSNIYSFNNYDIDYYKEIGADEITASYELNYPEFNRLDKSFMEANIYGYIPVMFSAGCVHKTTNKCRLTNKTHNADISELNRFISIKDKKDNEFKALNVCRYCYNILYNSLPLSLLGNMQELNRLEFNSYRINFTMESSNEVKEVLDLYCKLDTNEDVEYTLGGYTKGHFKRGID